MSLSLHTHVSKNIYENMTAILEIYAVVKKKKVYFNLTAALFSSKKIVGYTSKLVFIPLNKTNSGLKSTAPLALNNPTSLHYYILCM